MAFRSVTTLPLTRRELEVADLVRDGLTNREIASRLFLSERTVEGHVAQICRKLGLRSRLQVATWVVEQETQEIPRGPQLEDMPRLAAPARRPVRLQTWVSVALVAGLAIGGIASVGPAFGRSVQLSPPTITTLATGLNQPSGVVADPDRDAVYVADSANDTVRVLHGDGTSESIADKALGLPLKHPTGLAVDRAGRLFIADTGNHRILVFDRYYLAVLTGTGQPGFGGDNAPAETAQLDSPEDVAVDRLGNVYIADTGNDRIREIEASSGLMKTVAGGGQTDPFTGNYLGLYPLTIRLNHPEGVAVTSDGDLVLADTRAHAMYLVPRSAGQSFGPLRRLAGTGIRGYAGDGGPAPAARISEPRGLAINGESSIFFADSGNNRIRMISKDGVISTIAGSGALGFGGDTGPASGAQLAFPSAVSADPSGNIFVADTGNARIRILRGRTSPTMKKTPAGVRPTFPAGSFMAQIQARGKLVAFVRNNYPFFAYANPQNGRMEGFDIDMVRAVARAIFGRDDPSVLRLVTGLPSDRIPKVHGGVVDVADATQASPQNLSQVDVTDPYARTVDLLVVRKGSPIRSFADMAQRTVCVPNETTTLLGPLQTEATQSQPLLKGMIVAPLAQCLSALRTGRADALYDHSAGTLPAYASDPSVVYTPTLLAPRMWGFAVPKGHPEFVQFLNGLVEQLYKDGRWNAAARKWLNGYDDTFNVAIR